MVASNVTGHSVTTQEFSTSPKHVLVCWFLCWIFQQIAILCKTSGIIKRRLTAWPSFILKHHLTNVFIAGTLHVRVDVSFI